MTSARPNARTHKVSRPEPTRRDGRTMQGTQMRSHRQRESQVRRRSLAKFQRLVGVDHQTSRIEFPRRREPLAPGRDASNLGECELDRSPVRRPTRPTFAAESNAKFSFRPYTRPPRPGRARCYALRAFRPADRLAFG